MKKRIEPEKPSDKKNTEPVTQFTLAEFALEGSFNAATIVAEYSKFKYPAQMPELRAVMLQDMKALEENDMRICEHMLYAQAHALQTIFTELSRRAINRKNIRFMELYLKHAFKAQNQCRMTLETLSNVKNPPVVYAKQANINHGNQQVNNGIPLHENTLPSSHASNNNIKPNELLEADTDEEKRLDGRKAGKAIRNDSTVATMDPIERPKIRRRKKTLEP